MNDTNITTGAYLGSKMHTEYLTPFKAVIQNDFENAHILSHRNLFSNAVTNEYESGGGWFDSTIELMNEIMVYGCPIFAPACDGSNIPYLYTTAKTQLSIFRLNMKFLSDMRSWIWLRDVVSAACFADVGTSGGAVYDGADVDYGVLPYFLIGS